MTHFSLRRRAESDSSFVILAGLVLVMLLVMALLGGFGVWQWQRAQMARRMAEEQQLMALEAEMKAREQMEVAMAHERQLRDRKANGLADLAPPPLRSFSRATGLVTAPAGSPLHTLAFLAEPSRSP